MALRANASRLIVQDVSTSVAVRVAVLARSFRRPGALSRGDQAVRAALSVCSNIAESCGRTTVQEFRQFIGYAKGSAHELRAQLKVARLIDPTRAQEVQALENRVTLVIKMLGRLQQRPPPQY